MAQPWPRVAAVRPHAQQVVHRTLQAVGDREPRRQRRVDRRCCGQRVFDHHDAGRATGTRRRCASSWSRSRSSLPHSVSRLAPGCVQRIAPPTPVHRRRPRRAQAVTLAGKRHRLRCRGSRAGMCLHSDQPRGQAIPLGQGRRNVHAQHQHDAPGGRIPAPARANAAAAVHRSRRTPSAAPGRRSRRRPPPGATSRNGVAHG